MVRVGVGDGSARPHSSSFITLVRMVNLFLPAALCGPLFRHFRLPPLRVAFRNFFALNFMRFEQNHRKSLSLQFCPFLFFFFFGRRSLHRDGYMPEKEPLPRAVKKNRRPRTKTHLPLAEARTLYTNDEAIYYRANRPRQQQFRSSPKI